LSEDDALIPSSPGTVPGDDAPHADASDEGSGPPSPESSGPEAGALPKPGTETPGVETPGEETPGTEPGTEATPPPHRRSTGRVVLAVVVAVLVVVACVGFFLTRNQGTAIALSFTPGQSTTYHFGLHEDIVLSSGGQSFPVDATVSSDMQLRVVSVDSSGTATIRITYSNTTATVGGQTQSTTIPPVTAKLTSNGQMTTTGGAPIAGGTLGGPFTGGSDQLSAILPPGSVHVGDTWTKAVPLTLFVHGTFLRTENLGGTNAAVVRTTETTPMNYTVKLADYAGMFGLESGQVPASAEMAFSGHSAGTTTTWIDTAQKKLLKTSANVAIDATATVSGIPGGTGALGVKGTVSFTMSPA